MTGVVCVGMSGFSYPEWVGTFYPEGTKREQMLGRYAERFGAVEINMTFRRMPRVSTLGTWRDAVPEGFRFALKAHQRITHRKRLVDTADDVADFLRTSRTLGERLGPILFQTPPSLRLDARQLDAFFATLPPVAAWAFEPRHRSFTGPDVDALLQAHRVARCLNDELFDPQTYVRTAPIAYFRLRRDDYDTDALAALARLARAIADEGTDVYAFFKHEGGHGLVDTALRFQDLAS